MEIKFIKQEEDYGCVIACMAMVLGETYSSVRRHFLNDFSKKGISFKETIGYLADKGFQIIHKEVGFYNHIDFSRKEMLKPFAPVHIVLIRNCYDAKMTHVVVMTNKGKILCPQETPEVEIKECYQISDVWGFYK